MPVIECEILIDGVSDEPRHDVAIAIEEGEIVEVGDRGEITDDTAENSYHEHSVVIPGLIDAHCHLSGVRSMNPMEWVTTDVATMTARATADLRELVSSGFTAVRDVGSSTGLGLRTAVEEGEIPGPRVYTSGQAISQTGGHGDSHFLPYEWAQDQVGLATLADGPDECRKEARKRIRQGVDCIKIMTTGGVLSEKDAPDQSQFTDAEIRVFTEEAHRVGLPVASHAQGAPGIKRALENGVDTIEHGFYLDSEAIDLLLDTDATFIPTLAIMHRLVTEGSDHGVPEWGLEKSREAREAHFESVRRAYEADVPIALGTDFIGPELVPHGENALEAELFVEEIGMSEMEAVQAGTRVAARTVPDRTIGAVSEGMAADLVALESNPLEDISALQEVETVYRDGERVTV
jgi:imidazolonepropionase-like amidohydrolase